MSDFTSSMSTESFYYAFVVSLTLLLACVVRSVRARQIIYLFASYILYATWGVPFLGLLILSSLVNYTLGMWLRRHLSVACLWVGVVFNLAILGTFKYLPCVAILAFGRSSFGTWMARIALPVGLSFWTFQALSYLFDIYREEELDPSLVEFCLYMAFWPTVLSGPICRLGNLLPQFRQQFTPRREDFSVGFDRMFLGLLLMALAEMMGAGIRSGQGIDAAFASTATKWSGADVWCLAIGYGFQLFFNFAGYCHIVIGAARLFGIRLDENFSRPYLSTTPSIFWTRWHMSLSFWIRDYLFFPLATVRREKWWRNLALVFSMVTFGLWHRGAVLFAIWGLYHGILLVLHRKWQQLQRWSGFSWPQYVAIPVSWAVTFAAISFGWIFFRANDLRQSFAMVAAVFSFPSYGQHLLPPRLYALIALLAVGYFILIALSPLRRDRSEGICAGLPLEFKCALYGVMFYLAVLHNAEPQQFIYFQF
jgi:alginate O-acetyltransferase complex protein AlgI